MTEPVILYGTQSNGETLPVQVDATGRLVAEGLQGQEGPQGPPGPQGEGVPKPYGEEGDYLQIIDGVPTWASPPPDPNAPVVTLTDSINPSPRQPRVFRNASGGTETVTDNYDAWLRSQSFFPDGRDEWGGIGQDNTFQQDWFDFQLTNAFDYVLEITYAYRFNSTRPNDNAWQMSLTSQSTDVECISCGISGRANTSNWQGVLTSTFRVKTMDAVVRFDSYGSCQNPDYNTCYIYLQGYQLYKADEYALKKVIEMENMRRVSPIASHSRSDFAY